MTYSLGILTSSQQVIHLMIQSDINTTGLVINKIFSFLLKNPSVGPRHNIPILHFPQITDMILGSLAHHLSGYRYVVSLIGHDVSFLASGVSSLLAETCQSRMKKSVLRF